MSQHHPEMTHHFRHRPKLAQSVLGSVAAKTDGGEPVTTEHRGGAWYPHAHLRHRATEMEPLCNATHLTIEGAKKSWRSSRTKKTVTRGADATTLTVSSWEKSDLEGITRKRGGAASSHDNRFLCMWSTKRVEPDAS